MTVLRQGLSDPGRGGVSRRRGLLGVLLLPSLLLASEGLALDEVPSPPALEIVTSPAGTYRFVLRTAADWQSDAPRGELFRLDDGAPLRLWERALPQAVRARFALVSDRGQVVLLDDWWNVRSGRAVMLVGRDGKDAAVWSFEDVAAALDSEAKDLTALANHGAWIAAPPQFDDGGLSVLVPAGGKTLVIDPESGALSARP